MYDNQKDKDIDDMMCKGDAVDEKSELDKIIDRLQNMADYSNIISERIENSIDVMWGSEPTAGDEPNPVQINSKISDINNLLDVMDRRMEDFNRSANRLDIIA